MEIVGAAPAEGIEADGLRFFQPLIETGWRVRSISVFNCVSYNATESTLVRWGAGSTLLIHDRLMSIAG